LLRVQRAAEQRVIESVHTAHGNNARSVKNGGDDALKGGNRHALHMAGRPDIHAIYAWNTLKGSVSMY